MKKLFSVLIIVIMSFTVLPFIASANDFDDEFDYDGLFEFHGSDWRKEGENFSFTEENGWYYALDKETNTPLYVCGYIGDETDITVPTELYGVKLKGIKCLLAYSSTVKTLHIPKEVTTIIGNNDDSVYLETNAQEIIVDKKNPKFKSINGVLFDKEAKTLIYYPSNRVDDKYVIPETVETVIGDISSPYLKSLTITPNVMKIPTFRNTNLTELYFKNTTLNKKSFENSFPKAPNATIYCIEGSELYKAFKSISNKNTYYKKLVALETPKVPSKKAVINSVSYLDTANAVKLEMKDIGVTGFNIYRYSETSKIYEYIGYTLDNTYYDANVKKGVSYGYKVRPYNTENLVIAEGRFSDVKSSGNAIEAPIESALESSPEISEPTIDSEPEATAQSNESLSKETNTENNTKENNNLIIWIVLAVVLFGGIATGVAVIIKHKK